MSERLPIISRDSGNAETQQIYEKFSSTADKMFGSPDNSAFILTRKSDGALLGPFPFLMAQPDVGQHVLDLIGKLGQITGLPADAKEVAILTTGAKYKAAYELYAHTNVAMKTVGMSEVVVRDLENGKRPADLSEACSVAYDVAHYLTGTPGPLPRDLWDRSVDALGRDGTMGLVHYVGAYAYLCMMLNAMDAPIPESSG